MVDALLQRFSATEAKIGRLGKGKAAFWAFHDKYTP
jgi:hypothetical protein